MPFTASQILTGIILPAAILGVVRPPGLAAWNRNAVNDLRWIFGPLTAGAFGIAYWTFEPKPAGRQWAMSFISSFISALVAGILSLADAIPETAALAACRVLLIAWRMAVRLLLASRFRDISPKSQPNYGSTF